LRLRSKRTKNTRGRNYRRAVSQGDSINGRFLPLDNFALVDVPSYIKRQGSSKASIALSV
jgi:hypothetical protein